MWPDFRNGTPCGERCLAAQFPMGAAKTAHRKRGREKESDQKPMQAYDDVYNGAIYDGRKPAIGNGRTLAR